MKTYVLIYEGFVQFEVVLSNYFMKTKGEIVTVGLNNKEVTSWEGFRTLPHITLEEVDIKDVDLLILPGGDPQHLINDKKLMEVIDKLNSQGKTIGAICAAPLSLAKAGVLKGRKYTTTLPIVEFKDFNESEFVDENVVVDGNIITAKASGYVDFALELGKIMNIYENEADLQETIKYFKYFNVRENVIS
ncbi:DJ-1/PfpI family protein [Clostridium sp. D2Q-11]|uniref:DJ-1/PfpI family protein n=1 Tax=Anaeromonas frigoriresistens TaxID=2683708 RepID=A0A942Z7Z8_9FIRM|nr:DJ-1/PfpI family protein [Anaeromonas frigoriresistens]MBS4537440.1 DJ-1/PfpI family protein [Anaeromonas frigoriresistens]